MKQGALIFDEQTDRYDIRFDLADYYGGLHCGETFDVLCILFPGCGESSSRDFGRIGALDNG